MLLLALACTYNVEKHTFSKDTSTYVDTYTDTSENPCPENMVLIDNNYCMDKYEATLEVFEGDWKARSPYDTIKQNEQIRAICKPNQIPQGYISGEEASVACENSDKRLCTTDEWLNACQGPELWTYPYGETYDVMACNDTYGGTHPVIDYFGTSDGIWDTTHMNDPGINQQEGTLSHGGEFPLCVSYWEIYDMHGNLHEWVNDPDGTFRGGFYADAVLNGPGCTYRTTAHSVDYHDYSTGFRCCADPKL